MEVVISTRGAGSVMVGSGAGSWMGSRGSGSGSLIISTTVSTGSGSGVGAGAGAGSLDGVTDPDIGAVEGWAVNPLEFRVMRASPILN